MIAGVHIIWAQQGENQRWSNAIFRGNYQRSGVVDEPPARTRPRLKWEVDVKGPCAPVLFDGTLYTGESFWFPMHDIGNMAAEVYAIGLKKGDRRWSFEIQGPLGSPPLATKEKVYIGTLGGHLYALDRESGKVKWHLRDSEAAAIATSPVLLDDVLYYATWEGNLRAVDAAKGKILWSLRPDKWGKNLGDKGVAGEIAVRGDNLFVALGGESVVSVDPSTRTVKWHAPNQTAPRLHYTTFPSCSVGPHGRIYYLQNHGYVRAANAGLASIQGWGFGTQLTTEKRGITYKAENPVAPCLCVDEERLYLSSQHQRTYVQHTQKPGLVWQHTGKPGWWYFSPSVARDVLYVPFKKPDETGGVLAFDTKSGEKLWRYDTKFFVWQPPVIEDGVLYVATAKSLLALASTPQE